MLKLVSQDSEVILNAVLFVGMVLKPKLWNGGMTQEISLGVPLTKLLKAKATVPKDLSSDVPSGRNLHAHAGHLKG
jgi:hypothetical protein